MTKDKCHSASVIGDTSCSKDCKECFTYQYLKGPYIDWGGGGGGGGCGGCGGGGVNMFC